MSDEDHKQMELVAEIKVRRFFDHYLNEVFPEQLTQMIAAHNSDVMAHAPQIKAAIRAESSRIRLWLISLIFAGGAGAGVGVRMVIGLIAGI